ncbi:uncharacterized protein M6B38_338755 [Iris pallida]|uniref:DUF4378 domain-containing protein n=1 Tax=Iris pallida TaxID=29817 RepID=A0AAX6GZ39_IRIPA|nr:uncharacterized protein M6B38_338755 [Iris pallida]
MSLAITEKRPQQRPGSCVGIFFHLLSKKLFSKTLLPPAKKPAAKKLSGDDKVPMGKLLLIADERCNGRPKPDPQPEPDTGSRMQAPGIVARLMGLESMPVVPHERPRKALDSKFGNDDDGRFDRSRLDQGLFLDNAGGGKAESRPQRIERLFEKGAVEVFHRGLVGGSRKNQQVRLGPPPVKSPRLLSRSNTARLVHVANRILEPRSRGECAIAYKDPFAGEEEGVGEPLTGPILGSCSSCSSLVAVKEPAVSEFGCSALNSGNLFEEGNDLKSSATLSGQSNNGSEGNQTKPMPGENGTKSKSTGALNGQVKKGSLAIQAKLNAESRARNPVERKRDNHSNKSYVKKNGSRQNLLPASREEVTSGVKVCSRRQAASELNELHGSKDFLALNESLNNCARLRSPSKVSGSQSPELERNRWEKNVGGKKRPINSSQIGSVRAAGSTPGKQKSVPSDVINRKEFVSNQSSGSSCAKTAIRKLDGNNLSGCKNNGIVSFTFNSPTKRDSGSLAREGMVQRRRGQGELSQDAGLGRKFASDGKTGTLSSKGLTLRGVELSGLLEEKIRELSSLDQYELDTGDDLPGRSTASILEELISALTMGAPELYNSGDSSSDMSIRTDLSISHNQIGTIDKEFQEKDRPGNITAYLSSDTNQPSPVSILEALFSNDSCSFGSPTESSGGKSQFGLVAEICKKTLPLDSEGDLVDTATSSTVSQSSGEKIHHSINKSSSMYEFGVSQTEVSGDTTAISDAELLFEIISVNWSDGSLKSSFSSFLPEALETVTDASILNFHAEGYQLREFLVDCLMECMNSKFSFFWRFGGFETWMKLPSLLDREHLIGEVHAEIRGWRDLAGKVLDDLVEKDMSRTNISWIERNAETFEVGVEIHSDILQTLVDETLLDLCCY